MKKYLLSLFIPAILFSCNSEKNKAIQEKLNKEAEKVIAQTINGNLLTTDEITIRFVDELVKKEDLNFGQPISYYGQDGYFHCHTSLQRRSRSASSAEKVG